MNKIDCYIEEYKNEQGKLCVRLRDKVTNKKVAIIEVNADKDHLLRFLSQAKINLHMMPTVFDKNEKDIVAVRGNIDSEDEEEIVVNIDVETATFIDSRETACIIQGKGRSPKSGIRPLSNY